jgi:hypothetical protein
MPDLEAHPFAETFAKPAALIAVPVGLASPLWGLFAGAAFGGSAWWRMTRWARPENLEAMFGAAAEAAPALAAPEAVVAEAAPAAEAVVEAAESGVETVEAGVEAAEAVLEAPVLEAPVGGEAAPIPPAVAEAAAARPRVRKADPKPW